MTIQGCFAARQPLTTLLSFGLALTRSSPISRRARPGKVRQQPLDQRHHRIARRGDAEQDLIVRIVEPEGGAQRLLDMIVDAADRPHHAHSRRARIGDDAPHGPAAARRDRNARQVQQDGATAIDGSQPDQRAHRAGIAAQP